MKTSDDFRAALNDIAYDHRFDGDDTGYSVAVCDLMRNLHPDDLGRLADILIEKIREGHGESAHADLLGDLGNLNWFSDEYEPVRDESARKLRGLLSVKAPDVLYKTVLKLRCPSALPESLARIRKRPLIDCNGLVAALVHVDEELFLKLASKLFAEGLDFKTRDQRAVNVIPAFLFSMMFERVDRLGILVRRLLEETSTSDESAGVFLKKRLSEFVRRNRNSLMQAGRKPGVLLEAIEKALED